MRMMGEGAIAVLPAATEKVRNRTSYYPFRQDSDFHYLTGFPEPDAVAVLAPGRRAAEYILFCRSRDAAAEAWEGRRAGQEGAQQAFGADDSFPIEDIDEILPGLLEGREKVYYTMGAHPEFDQRVIGWVNELRGQARLGKHAPQEFVSLEHLLHDMRLYKSPLEVEALRRAARIAARGHRRAMQRCRPGLFEYELEAELGHEFRVHGGTHAYPPIVGGGDNANILHYRDNAAPLRDGDLVLIDSGCEHSHYASDVTRTFPVNGRFSPAQRAIYEVVLTAQRAAIAQAVAGNDWDAMHQAAVKVLTLGMIELGLLKGSATKLIKGADYKRWYMHRTGHWLGMDVHDVGDYKIGDRWRELEPGMVMTVEPGIYVPLGAKGAPKALQGIGVRIEDDVLVTRGKPEVLSEDAPKDVAAVEALMAEGRGQAARRAGDPGHGMDCDSP
jgi:Xaa-Pro aminopeptidase